MSIVSLELCVYHHPCAEFRLCVRILFLIENGSDEHRVKSLMPIKTGSSTIRTERRQYISAKFWPVWDRDTWPKTMRITVA